MVYSVGTRMLYLKLVPNDFNNASHDKRELSVAKELGYKVRIFATTKKTENYREVDVCRIMWFGVRTRCVGRLRGSCGLIVLIKSVFRHGDLGRQDGLRF